MISLLIHIVYLNGRTPTVAYTLSLHDALPILRQLSGRIQEIIDELLDAVVGRGEIEVIDDFAYPRSEEHTSELQSLRHLVCRLLLEKNKYDNEQDQVVDHYVIQLE